MDADVIVVGGGPGGGSAAYFLQQKGYKVLLLEKEKIPRYKTCAGAVPHGALELFPFSFEPVIEETVQLATFAYQNKQTTFPIPKDKLAMVRREKFDAYILEKSGAEILSQTKVIGLSQEDNQVRVRTENNREFRSRYVIGADGPLSRVARSSGLRTNKSLGIGLEVELQVQEKVLRNFQGRILIGLDSQKKGYYWIFPKKSLLSLGIGTINQGVKNLRSHFIDIMNFYDINIEQTKHHAHPIPIHFKNELLHNNRVLLVGDAAGLVDPMIGEGIRYAIESGKKAAEVIQGNNINNYSREIAKFIGTDLLWSYRLSQFFYSLQTLNFELIVRNQLLFRELIKILTNQSSYKKTILKLPFYLLQFWKRNKLDI